MATNALILRSLRSKCGMTTPSQPDIDWELACIDGVVHLADFIFPIRFSRIEQENCSCRESHKCHSSVEQEMLRRVPRDARDVDSIELAARRRKRALFCISNTECSHF